MIEGEEVTKLSLEVFGGGEVGGERGSSISERGNCMSKGSEPSGEGRLVLFGSASHASKVGAGEAG